MTESGQGVTDVQVYNMVQITAISLSKKKPNQMQIIS